MGLQEFADGDDAVRPDHQGQLAPVEFPSLQRRGIEFEQGDAIGHPGYFRRDHPNSPDSGLVQSSTPFFHRYANPAPTNRRNRNISTKPKSRNSWKMTAQ